MAFLENYEWSSYRNYIGKVPQERFVHTGTILELCCRFLIKNKKLKEIGESLGGISVSGLWMSRERLKSRLKNDSQIRGRFERIKATILS